MNRLDDLLRLTPVRCVDPEQPISLSFHCHRIAIALHRTVSHCIRWIRLRLHLSGDRTIYGGRINYSQQEAAAFALKATEQKKRHIAQTLACRTVGTTGRALATANTVPLPTPTLLRRFGIVIPKSCLCLLSKKYVGKTITVDQGRRQRVKRPRSFANAATTKKRVAAPRWAFTWYY